MARYNVCNMLEGECPKCGQKYYGLALANPRHQTCAKCGVGLIIKDGEKVIKGFSPFSTDNIRINYRHKKGSSEKTQDG
jgi:DNA-directed RNA polymerase subunit RPC12/RpoP